MGDRKRIERERERELAEGMRTARVFSESGGCGAVFRVPNASPFFSFLLPLLGVATEAGREASKAKKEWKARKASMERIKSSSLGIFGFLLRE